MLLFNNTINRIVAGSRLCFAEEISATNKANIVDNYSFLPALEISQMITPITTTTINMPVHIPALKIPAIALHPAMETKEIINKK